MVRLCRVEVWRRQYNISCVGLMKSRERYGVGSGISVKEGLFGRHKNILDETWQERERLMEIRKRVMFKFID